MGLFYNAPESTRGTFKNEPQTNVHHNDKTIITIQNYSCQQWQFNTVITRTHWTNSPTVDELSVKFHSIWATEPRKYLHRCNSYILLKIKWFLHLRLPIQYTYKQTITPHCCPTHKLVFNHFPHNLRRFLPLILLTFNDTEMAFYMLMCHWESTHSFFVSFCSVSIRFWSMHLYKTDQNFSHPL